MKDIWQRIVSLERRNLRIGQVLSEFEETYKQAETARTLLSAAPRIVITGTEPDTPYEFTPYVMIQLHGMRFGLCNPTTDPDYTTPIAPTAPLNCPQGIPSPFAINEQDKLFENTLCLLTETFVSSGQLSARYRTEQTVNGVTQCVAEVIASESGAFQVYKSIYRTNANYWLGSLGLYSGSPTSFAMGTSGNIRTNYTMQLTSPLYKSGYKGDAFIYNNSVAYGSADLQVTWGM